MATVVRPSIRHVSILDDGSLSVIAGKYPKKDNVDASFFALTVGDEKTKQVLPI